MQGPRLRKNEGIDGPRLNGPMGCGVSTLHFFGRPRLMVDDDSRYNRITAREAVVLASAPSSSLLPLAPASSRAECALRSPSLPPHSRPNTAGRSPSDVHALYLSPKPPGLGSGRRLGQPSRRGKRGGPVQMRLWDVNLWVYAFRSDSPLHVQAFEVMQDSLNKSPQPFQRHGSSSTRWNLTLRPSMRA
jgi:hypothetical protein